MCRSIIDIVRSFTSLRNYITSSLALTFSPNSSTICECLGERMNFGRWGFRCSKRDTCVRETQKTVIPKRFAKYPYNSPENIREQFGREMRFSLQILIRFFVKLHPHTGKRLQIWSNFFLRLVDTPSLYPVKIFGAVIIFRYSKHSHTNWHFG